MDVEGNMERDNERFCLLAKDLLRYEAVDFFPISLSPPLTSVIKDDSGLDWSPR